MLGKLLDGRYQIIQPLGAGGFGQTYLAQDTRRPGNPTCVVKHLKPISNDSEFLPTARRLFNSEAETLEKLGHHNQIPRLLAYFEEEREFYLVQDYIEGRTLTQELIPDRPWTESRVIQLLQGVLPVLEFVHSQGVIHRDIKPDNLLRRQGDGKLVLVDFGAVKQVTTQMFPDVNSSGGYTVAIGTPGYMPSEQAKGQPRPSSDLYALGAIALQAMTGINPNQFEYDPHTGEILWQHRVAVNPRLATILTGMVRYHFRDRYQSAREVLQALDQLSIPVAPTQQTPLPRLEESQTAAPPDYSLPLSQKQTYAVGGIAPPPPPAPSPVPSPRQPEATPAPRKPDRLPWIMLGSTLGLIFAIVFGISLAVRQIPSNSGNQNGNQATPISKTDLKSCAVVLQGTLNVRSGPGTDKDVVDGVKTGTTLTLTGQEQAGWVEISAPAKGWVYNSAEYIKCSTSNTPIAVAPPQPKPTPKPEPDRGPDLLKTAQDLYEKGDLDGAIAKLQSIPKVSQVYDEAQGSVENWRSAWTRAQERYNQANRAFEQGKWDDVIAFGNTNLPDNAYWRKLLTDLSEQARQRKAEEEAQNNPPPSPSPQPPEELEKPDKDIPEGPEEPPSEPDSPTSQAPGEDFFLFCSPTEEGCTEKLKSSNRRDRAKRLDFTPGELEPLFPRKSEQRRLQ